MGMERLIEEVRKYSVLYDQTDEKYRNSEYKERVWKKIAAELKTKGGGEECKKKWASIRDQFRRTLQKRKTTSGQAAAPYRKYKYAEFLQFLSPHLAERDTLSNIPSTEVIGDNEESLDVAVKEETIDEPEFMQENRELEPEMESKRSDEEVVTARNVTIKSGTFVRPKLKSKTQRQLKVQESASSQLMAYILSEKKTKTPSKEAETNESQKHPVDAFLAGIAPPLKSLNPILLNQAKSRIFSIVQEYEMKQLMASQEQLISHPYPFVPQNNQLSPASSSSGNVPTPYISPNEYETNVCPVYCELSNASQRSEQPDTNHSQNLSESFSK